MILDEHGNQLDFVDWKLFVPSYLSSPRLDVLKLTFNPSQFTRLEIPLFKSRSNPSLFFFLYRSRSIVILTVYVFFSQQWRHSSHSKIYIHSFESNRTFAITPDSTVSYSSWSPAGHGFTYVSENDLYVLSEDAITGEGIGKSIRVTTDGSGTIFNGVPDWVYEEEVFSKDSAFVYSPSGQEIMYLRFDETDVPEYEFPIYDEDEDLSTVKPYPLEVVMRYPKPGCVCFFFFF